MVLLRSIILACFGIIILSNSAFFQSEDDVQYLDFDNKKWSVTATDADVENKYGRDSLALKSGRVWLDDVEFSDGVIEFDVAYDEMVGFLGTSWRGESDKHFEEMYFRV